MANRIIPRSPYYELEKRVDILESSGIAITGEIPSGDIDGMNITFITSNNYVTESLRVSLNGLRLSRGVGNDYVESTPDTFIMNYTPLPGDTLEVDYQKSIV